MVINPVLVDEHGRRIYSSQETDKQPSGPSQTLYESKFVRPEDVRPETPSLSKPILLPSDDDPAHPPRIEQPGPFFVNMADNFRIQNRIMGHLKDKFENDHYESLKRQSNVSKHVSSLETHSCDGRRLSFFRQNLFYRNFHSLCFLTRNSPFENHVTKDPSKYLLRRPFHGMKRSSWSSSTLPATKRTPLTGQNLSKK